MRQVEVAASNAGQRYPSPWGAGTRMTCDPRRLGKAVASTCPARAWVISFSLKYGRRALSGSGNRQQTSHCRQVRLGTSCGNAIGGVTPTRTNSSGEADIEGFRSMCGHTSTIPQEFPRRMSLFSPVPFSKHATICPVLSSIPSEPMFVITATIFAMEKAKKTVCLRQALPPHSLCPLPFAPTDPAEPTSISICDGHGQVHEHPLGTLALFHEPQCPARDHGSPREP